MRARAPPLPSLYAPPPMPWPCWARARHEVAQVRLDRAELLIGLGEQARERALLKEAEAEMHRLGPRS